jgi:outer membrane receptor protein involved in Fe transport
MQLMIPTCNNTAPRFRPGWWIPVILCSAAAWAEDPADGTLDGTAGVLEEIVVEATRATLSLSDIPVNASLLSQQDVREFSTGTTDEILRQVPGFSLLRSADSIATAPTTSTVSLRGLGGNAASRTLVLLDGMPIHSPYSSEVFWSRVPRQRIDHVEIVRGGGANAWGNLSLGGVINIVTEKQRDNSLAFSGSLGYPQTIDLSMAGNRSGENWTLAGDVSYYDTDGYMNVPERQQGPVDEEVRKDFTTLSGRATYHPDDSTRVYLQASWFDEERGGGSALDVNTTEIRNVGAGFERNAASGRWSVQAFHDDTELEDVSVLIIGDNESETVRSFEIRPTQVTGAGLTWSRTVGGSHQLTAGADYRWSEVKVDEWGGFRDGVPTQLKTTDSTQDFGGVFIQDSWKAAARWRINASLRFDYVTNSGAVNERDLVIHETTGTKVFESNSETTWNPSLGTVFQATDRVSLRAAAYRGFRAATLRELYHSARIRSGVNLVNNPALAPERLVGMEGGIDVKLSHASLGLTVFRNTVEDLIQNITRGTSGDLPETIEPCGLIGPNETCRELDNVGEMRATGLELETVYRPADEWLLQLSYLYNDTEITRAPGNPQLEGNRVRQAPEHSFTARVRNSNRWFDTSLLARYVGERYEDDLNNLEVDGFLLFGLYFSRQVNERTELFLNVENLLDEEYEIRVENSGAIEIGRPRFIGLGLRFRG